MVKSGALGTQCNPQLPAALTPGPNPHEAPVQQPGLSTSVSEGERPRLLGVTAVAELRQPEPHHRSLGPALKLGGSIGGVGAGADGRNGGLRNPQPQLSPTWGRAREARALSVTQGRGRSGPSPQPRKARTTPQTTGYFPCPGPGTSPAKLPPSCGDSMVQAAPPPSCQSSRCPSLSVPTCHRLGQTLLPALPGPWVRGGAPALRPQTPREAAVLSSSPRPATRTEHEFRPRCRSGQARVVPCLVTTACGRRRGHRLGRGLLGACPGLSSPTPSSPGCTVSLLSGHPESNSARPPAP